MYSVLELNWPNELDNATKVANGILGISIKNSMSRTLGNLQLKLKCHQARLKVCLRL